MGGTPQLDPALKELALRRTGHLLDELPPSEAAAEEVAVVAKLVDPTIAVPGLRVVARFGPVVTGRVGLDKLLAVRGDSNVFSLKASLHHRPAAEPVVAEEWGPPSPPAPSTSATGRGVAVAVAGWGCDFVHRNFRHADGRTRLLWLWDQRGGPQPSSPQPFGYGREFSREQIDAALATSDPYAALGYDPADADPFGNGCHDTHVLDIAAGNGAAPGSSPGVAPAAELVFCHLRGDDTDPKDTLGDSARLLEAVRWMTVRAGDRPVAINCSLGRTGGPHDATPLVVQALDDLLERLPGCVVVLSTGNYYQADLHRRGRLAAGETVDLRWRVAPGNDEVAELEVWYPGADRFGVELVDPNGRLLASVPAGEDRVVRQGDAIVAAAFHRLQDPNNGDNQLDVFLWPDAMLGTWVVRLHGETIRDGSWHAWIERDDPRFQSRFVDQADPTFTTGTIANGHHTIVVGAYDARWPNSPMAPFSSAGPTRDLRQRPDCVGPGAGIRAARSSRPGRRRDDELTVKSGTSMAAPFVCGVVARMFEAAGERRLWAAQVRDILIATAAAPPPWDEPSRLRYGAGRVDPVAAVEAVLALAVDDTDRQPDEAVPAMASSDPPPGPVGAPADNDEALRSRLASSLPKLLVDYADSELRRLDEHGVPVYDQHQPLVFAPTGRRYHYEGGGPAHHAANLVYNSAYALGYQVPVHPPGRRAAHEGHAYPNTAQSFRALAAGDGAAEELRRFFTVVAAPRQEGKLTEVREGDLLLGTSTPSQPLGHLSIIADPRPRPMGDPFFRDRDAGEGTGLHCIGCDPAIRDRAGRFGRVLADDDGLVLEDRMVIRFKPSAIDLDRVRQRTQWDDAFRRVLWRPRAGAEESAAVWGAGGLCHPLAAGTGAATLESAGDTRSVLVSFRYGDGAAMAGAGWEAAFGDRRLSGRADERGDATIAVPAGHAGPFCLWLRSFEERYVDGGDRP